MYKIYQNAIQKYILQQTGATKIKYDGDTPKLFLSDITYRAFTYCDMEAINQVLVTLCIRYMIEFMNIDKLIDPTIRKINEEAQIEYQGNVINIYDKYDHSCWKHFYHFNGYQLRVLDSSGYRKLRGLLLFLIDPLEFINRNNQEISLLDDINVKSLLFGLKESVENMKVMHIKCLLVMEVDLVTDIIELVVNKYIDISFNRGKLLCN